MKDENEIEIDQLIKACKQYEQLGLDLSIGHITTLVKDDTPWMHEEGEDFEYDYVDDNGNCYYEEMFDDGGYAPAQLKNMGDKVIDCECYIDENWWNEYLPEDIKYDQDSGYYMGTLKDVTDGLNDAYQVIIDAILAMNDEDWQAMRTRYEHKHEKVWRELDTIRACDSV